MQIPGQAKQSPKSIESWVPFLSSLILHLLLVLFLAIVVHGDSGSLDSRTMLQVELNSNEETPSFDITPSASNPAIVVGDSPRESQVNEVVERETRTEPSLQLERDRTEEFVPSPVSNLFSEVASSSASSMSGAFTVTSLESRFGANRKEAAAQRGGNAASERAVEAALVWLARHQNLDGGWDLQLGAPCDGTCHNASTHADPQRAAATGLALLCFLGAGYTHHEGPYQKVVNDGLYYLMQIMVKDKRGGHFFQPIAQFALYEHGIATLALCEAYQMTGDSSLRPFCEDAIQFIYYSQHGDGGWGYDPKTPGDLSIACWQMMAIKSAVAGKVRIPTDSIRSFDRFLDSQQSEKGALYGYRSTKPKPSTTAMGLLMRMYRGWPKTDGRIMRGAEYVANGAPSPNDVYFNYYGTQLLFQLGGPLWDEWNPKMRDYLISTQASNGHEQGSWYFEHPLNHVGGRLYTTAMSCMTLEVYYRHMPIYGPIQFDRMEL